MSRIIFFLTIISLQKISHLKEYDENLNILENKIPKMFYLGNQKLELLTKNNDKNKNSFSLTGFFKYFQNEIPSVNILKIKNNLKSNLNKNFDFENFFDFEKKK